MWNGKKKTNVTDTFLNYYLQRLKWAHCKCVYMWLNNGNKCDANNCSKLILMESHGKEISIWKKRRLNPQYGFLCRCLLSPWMSSPSGPHTCKHDLPAVHKVNNLHPRMIQIINCPSPSEVSGLSFFCPCIPTGIKHHLTATASLYVPFWYILEAPVNLCTCLIRSIWIVFAWKHSFSLSCKQDEKTKQTCTQCRQDVGAHADTVNALLALLSQQIPVDCLLIPANMPLVEFQ